MSSPLTNTYTTHSSRGPQPTSPVSPKRTSRPSTAQSPLIRKTSGTLGAPPRPASSGGPHYAAPTARQVASADAFSSSIQRGSPLPKTDLGSPARKAAPPTTPNYASPLKQSSGLYGSPIKVPQRTSAFANRNGATPAKSNPNPDPSSPINAPAPNAFTTIMSKGRSSSLTNLDPERMHAMRVTALRAKLREDLRAEKNNNGPLNQLLTLMCENCGWSMCEVTQKPDSYTVMELALLNLPRIPQLQYFNGLKKIRLVSISLTDMSCLEHLDFLEEAYLSDNNIFEIKGLDNCPTLRILSLQNNYIVSLKNLPLLPNLEELYLGRNRLQYIENMDKLPRLRKLDLASNSIRILENSFPNGHQFLRELNLSANRITSYTMLSNLSDLQHLWHVSFCDPLYGPNPICRARYYVNTVRYYMPQVRTIDFEKVIGPAVTRTSSVTTPAANRNAPLSGTRGAPSLARVMAVARASGVSATMASANSNSTYYQSPLLRNAGSSVYVNEAAIAAAALDPPRQRRHFKSPRVSHTASAARTPAPGPQDTQSTSPAQQRPSLVNDTAAPAKGPKEDTLSTASEHAALQTVADDATSDTSKSLKNLILPVATTGPEPADPIKDQPISAAGGTTTSVEETVTTPNRPSKVKVRPAPTSPTSPTKVKAVKTKEVRINSPTSAKMSTKASAGAHKNGGEEDGSHCKKLLQQALAHGSEASELLELVAESNGYTTEELLSKPHTIRFLELFLLQVSSLPVIQCFQNLTKLHLLHISLKDLSCVEELTNLEELNAPDNYLTQITGLRHCLRLRKLNLDNNLISKIENISHLMCLEELRMARNKLEHVSGISGLQRLRRIWLPGNQIAHVSGNCFPASTEELNLAANRLFTFQCLPEERDLPNLTSLILKDPLFGENPLCAFPNYAIFTISAHQELTWLDFEMIAPDQRTLAESICSKKRTFYAMRTATLRRNFNVLWRYCAGVAHRKVGELVTSLGELEHMESNGQQQVDEAAYYQLSCPNLKGLAEKLQDVRKAIQSRNSIIESVYSKSREAVAMMEAEVTKQTQYLDMECDTGGNVRLVEGKPEDAWFQRTEQLVKSRFFAKEYDAALGFKDIKVCRITRIINQGLRARFDRTLNDLSMDISDPQSRKALVCLFSTPTVELRQVLIHGFDSVSAPEGWVMTNSVFLADRARLEEVRKKSCVGIIPPQAYVGTIMISRAFLGKSDPLRPGGRQAALEEGTYSAFSPGGPGADPTSRIWHCYQEKLLLPEFLVEFAYIPGESVPLPPLSEWGQSSSEKVVAAAKLIRPSASRVEVQDFIRIGYAALSFVQWVQSPGLEALANRDGNHHIPGPTRSAVNGPLVEKGLEEYLKILHFKESAPESFSYCNLQSLGITALNCSVLLSSCKFLRILCLQYNSIVDLNWTTLVQATPHLKRLDLSNNGLKRLQRVQGHVWKELESLSIARNQLAVLLDIPHLASFCPTIRQIRLEGNPIFNEHRALEFVLTVLPNSLEVVNQFRVTEYEPLRKLRESPKATSAALIAKLVELANELMCGALKPTGNDSKRLPCLQDCEAAYGAALNDIAKGPGGVTGIAATPASKETARVVHTFVLQHTKLRSLNNVAESLTGVRRLQLRGNFLWDLAPLKSLRVLQYLDLEDNMISSISPLTEIKSLTYLNVRCNALERIDSVANLTSLRVLILDDNKITGLNALEKAPALVELYMANNKLSNEKSLFHLKDLPNLEVLDLFGNPCAHNDHFRLYVAFQLKQLCVLNGSPVTAKELQQARSTFAGRVTEELLRERIPSSLTKTTIQELSLSSCALREVSMMETVKQVTVLRLDHNYLSSVEGLQPMLRLMALNLSNNRLGNCAVGTVLSQLPCLESLSIESNGITSIAGLRLRQPSLKFLNLKSNEITRVDGLVALPKLCEILLDRNKLRSIDPDSFAGVHQLQQLSCEENAIKNIEGVRYLQSLQKASFCFNRFSEISDLTRILDQLPIETLTFHGNPVVRKPQYRLQLIATLPRLVALDQKEVSSEERAKAVTNYATLVNAAEAVPPNVFMDVRPAVNPSAVRQTAPIAGITLDPGDNLPYSGRHAAGPSAGGVRPSNPGLFLGGTNSSGNRQPQLGVVSGNANGGAMGRPMGNGKFPPQPVQRRPGCKQ